MLLLGSVLSISVSEAALPLVVLAPAVDEAVLGSGDTVVLSALDVHNVVALNRVEVLDPLRNGSVDSVANAQLTPVVQAPSEHLLLIVDVERMLVAAENVLRVFGAKFFDFQSLRILVSRVQHSTDLAGLSVAPSKNFSTSGQSQSMVRSARHFFQPRLRFGVEKLLGYSRGLLNF